MFLNLNVNFQHFFMTKLLVQSGVKNYCKAEKLQKLFVSKRGKRCNWAKSYFKLCGTFYSKCGITRMSNIAFSEIFREKNAND